MYYPKTLFDTPTIPKNPRIIPINIPAAIANPPNTCDTLVRVRIIPAIIKTTTIPEPPIPNPNIFCAILSPHFMFYFKSKVIIKVYKVVSTIYLQIRSEFCV